MDSTKKNKYISKSELVKSKKTNNQKKSNSDLIFNEIDLIFRNIKDSIQI